MRVSEEKKKYLDLYFKHINFLGELEISAVKQMVESKGQGAEYVSCSFDPMDEDYKEGYVTLFFWKPADEEDTMIYIENSMFYERLVEVCKAHIIKKTDDTELIYGYLKKIKKSLNVVIKTDVGGI